MKRVLLAVALLLAVSPAYAQKTKAQLNTEIGVQFPDNTSNLVTPSNLRTVTTDIVNSIMPAAPVVSGNLACFNGTTGVLFDCGRSPTNITIFVGSTPISGGTNTRVLFDNNGTLGELATSGSGNVALTSSPVFAGITVTSINSFSMTRGASSTASFAIGDTTTAPSMNGASDNVAIGTNAGFSLTSGTQNVLIGTQNGQSLSNDTGNVLIGYQVANSLHNGGSPTNYNTAIGNSAMSLCTTCASSVAIGRAALFAETTGIDNTAVGHAALLGGVGNTQVTAIGDVAGGTALAGAAIPAGFPNTGVNVFGLNGDTNVECMGDSCGKTSAAARKQSFTIGSYARIPAQDNSFWLGNGMVVGGTSAKMWNGNSQMTVNNTGGVSLTAAQILSGFIDRTGLTGPGTDTLPTAAQIVTSTAGGPGDGCELTSRQIWYSNRTGQTATIASSTGILLASVTGAFTVAANSGSIWNMQITNCASGTEAVTFYRMQ